MLHEPDADGRRDLSGKEWDAICRLFVSLSEQQKCIRYLEERLKLIPGGWRDIKMLSNRTHNLLDKIFDTIPFKKLFVIDQELKNSEIKMVVRGADRSLPDGVMYVPNKALFSLLNKVISLECWDCQKKGKDVKRCDIYKCIFDTLPYNADPDQIPKDGSCVMAGSTELEWETEEAEC